MKKSKKVILGTFSALAATISPIVIAVSCGEKEKVKITTPIKDEDAQVFSKINIEEIKKEFDASIKRRVQIRIPFVSKETDKLAAEQEYKEMIKDFFVNYKRNGKIITILSTKDDEESKKISAVIKLKEFISRSADPTKDELIEASEAFKKAGRQSLSIKEFVFFDETKKDDVGTTIKLDPQLFKKVSEEDLIDLEFIKKSIENWELIENLQSTDPEVIDKIEGDPNDQRALSELQRLNVKRTSMEQEAAQVFQTWIS
ncbi:Vmc-like lipoprotein signal peptide domain-containing protein [Mycoplasma todarodis]|uniref:Vmc-like lipoprotein signal peptide domain-containing protein n=1 Tax=Mycoplasma todarodis TaxID=1937191 RepID=UPI003B2D865D